MAKSKGVEYKGTTAMPGSELHRVLTEAKEGFATKAKELYEALTTAQKKSMGEAGWALHQSLMARPKGDGQPGSKVEKAEAP